MTEHVHPDDDPMAWQPDDPRYAECEVYYQATCGKIAALTARVAALEDALSAFLSAWGTIHESPDWVDPSVTNYSPIAVGIPVEIALQARAALASGGGDAGEGE